MDKINQEVWNIEKRYDLCFDGQLDISKGFGDYLNDALLKKKGEKYPILYYNALGVNNFKGMPEDYLVGNGIAVKKSSRPILAEEKNKYTCYACALYVDLKNFEIFNFAIRYIFDRAEKAENGDLYKKITNVKKLNYYGEFREFNEIPIALYDNNEEYVYSVVEKLREDFPRLSFNIYKVNRDIMGEPKDYYEIDMSFLLDSLNMSVKTYATKYYNSIYCPVMFKLFDDLENLDGLHLLNASGLPMDLDDILKIIPTNSKVGKQCSFNIMHLYQMNGQKIFSKINNALYSKPAEPLPFALNSSANEPVKTFDFLALRDNTKLKDYFDKTMLQAPSNERAVLFMVCTRNLDTLVSLRNFIRCSVPSCYIKSKKIDVLKEQKSYFSNMFYVAKNEEIRFFSILPQIYSKLEAGYTDAMWNCCSINSFGELRQCGEMPVALINAKVSSPEMQNISKELKKKSSFEFNIRSVSRPMGDASVRASEISVKFFDEKDKDKQIKTGNFYPAIADIYDKIDSLCNRNNVQAIRLYSNGEMRESFDSPVLEQMEK